MRFEVLTILPGLLHSYLQEGIIGRAIRDDIIKVNLINLRDFGTGRHKQTDDRPYGGGPGQVMTVPPLAEAIRSLPPSPKSLTLCLSARGRPFNYRLAKELSQFKRIVLVCGRYEGIDQRFIDRFVDMEVSAGDYILTGGELAAMMIVDAVSRFVPGVLGNGMSVEEESFSNGLLEYPQYAPPRDFEGMTVPDVLLSGNHHRIEEFRKAEAILVTKKQRPDLL